jgi:hypothetical protein
MAGIKLFISYNTLFPRYSVGVHALATVIFYVSGDLSKAERHLGKLLAFLPDCLGSEVPDEVLYGRAGYLFCLLMVQKHVSEELWVKMNVSDAVKQTFDALITSGKENGKDTG